jgi:hypothetical protein
VGGDFEPANRRMMYTAMSLRGMIIPPTSYWFSALGFFNISISTFPTTLPPSEILWHRARIARRQTLRSVKSKYIIPNTLNAAHDRLDRSYGISLPIIKDGGEDTPSIALCGLSLIGDLDKTYIQEEYDPEVRLRDVVTASKQRQGGFLVLEHTFRGKLGLHLVWDVDGFEGDVIERFWEEVTGLVKGVSSHS